MQNLVVKKMQKAFQRVRNFVQNAALKPPLLWMVALLA
jgi:hypothetical protein